MNKAIKSINSQGSIFSQSGISKILNANVHIKNDKMKLVNSSESFEYTNFQDINKFKQSLEVWNQNIGKILVEREISIKLSQNKPNEPLEDLMKQMINNEKFQEFILNNTDLQEKFKKSLK